MIPNPISALPVSYDAYLRHGWHLVPIAPMSKGPRTPNWNQKANCITNSNQIPPGWGIGLAHAYSGTCAIDIDDEQTAAAYLHQCGISLKELFDAPDAVTIESGNKGHGKLIYAMPFGLVLNSKKLMATRQDGSKFNFLDLRCSTADHLTVQDVLPPTIHPTTCQPYQWGGRGNWQRLPLLPPPLLELWSNLLAADQQRILSTGSKLDASWDEVASALHAINPDIGRDEWVEVGMALQHAGAQSKQLDQAYQLWDEWSSRGTKYKGQNDTQACWRSFKPDHGITLGTLIHHAQEAGWVRPLPDVSGMFPELHIDPGQLIDLITLKTLPPGAPIHLFPEVLAKRAEYLSEANGLDPVIPMVAGLAACCAAVDARIKLRLTPTYRVPPVLWIMTIGDPADKKTPGANPQFEVLDQLERADRERFKAEHLIWKGHEARYTAELKNFTLHMSEGDHSPNTVVPSVKPLPEEPRALRLTVEDITSQKLIDVCRGRPYGLLLKLDEMNNWMTKINDPKSGDDRGAWIAGYEVRGYRMDRVTSGEVEAESVGLSIYGNIQPQVFKDHLKRMSSDGMIQRFIPVRINGEKNKMYQRSPTLVSNQREYEELVRRMRTIQVGEYSLSPGAERIFDEFAQWQIELNKDERFLQNGAITYRTALGKLLGTCGRLALVFHLIENPHEREVSEDTMNRVVLISKGFIWPSLRYAFAGTDQTELEQYVIDLIVQCSGEMESITIGQIKRYGRNFFANRKDDPIRLDQEIKLICEHLCDHKYLIQIEENRKTTRYAINPTIATMFHDYRENVIRTKQASRDRFLDVTRAIIKREPNVTPVIGERSLKTN